MRRAINGKIAARQRKRSEEAVDRSRNAAGLDSAWQKFFLAAERVLDEIGPQHRRLTRLGELNDFSIAGTISTMVSRRPLKSVAPIGDGSGGSRG